MSLTIYYLTGEPVPVGKAIIRVEVASYVCQIRTAGRYRKNQGS